MKKTAHPFTKSDPEISIQELDRWALNWLADCRIRQHSHNTIAARRFTLDKLFWFLREQGFTTCGLQELRRFFVYLNDGHTESSGRWGNAQIREPMRPSTLATYHRHLRTFFSWLVNEEILEYSPMERIRPPIVREDQIQPFTPEQVKALIQAARKSRHPRRDEAIIRFLHDAGVRASELCNIRMEDLNLSDQCCRILGKGNKYRTIPFGRDTYKAIWRYIQEDSREELVSKSKEPLFLADRGKTAGEPLTRSGLFQLIQRLGQVAGISVTRCSPHTLRHTFAIEFLRAGGNIFTLKALLGHTSLAITNRYVALAQADLQSQHRAFSPGDRLREACR